MIPLWLRRNLGIVALEARVQQLQNEVDGFKQMAGKVLSAQAEVNGQIQRLREVSAEICDPKLRPVVTQTMRQYRALMEKD